MPPASQLFFAPDPHVLYRVALIAANRAGLRSTFEVATPFMYDPTPPTLASVQICDAAGQPSELRAQSASQQHLLHLCLALGAPPPSGVSGFRVKLTAAGSSVVVEEREVRYDDIPVPALTLAQQYESGALP